MASDILRREGWMPRSPWFRYGIVLPSVGLSLLVHCALDHVLITRVPLMGFVLGVAISALVGGLGPGLVATTVSLALGLHFFHQSPREIIAVRDEWVRAAMFVTTSLVLCVLSGARDFADRRASMSLNSLRNLQQWFRVAQEMSLNAFALLKAVRDEAGSVVDFEWEYVNPTGVRLLDVRSSGFVGRRLLETMPGLKSSSDLFGRLVTVVETGHPHDIDVDYDADGVRGRFRNMAVKVEDGVAVSWSLVADRRHPAPSYRHQVIG